MIENQIENQIKNQNIASLIPDPDCETPPTPLDLG